MLDGRKVYEEQALGRVCERAHGFVSAPLAYDGRKGTGFTEEDLALLFEALTDMFEHDRSAARGEMTARRLIVFRHPSALGNARAQNLFARVRVGRVPDGAEGLARSFEDYQIDVDGTDLPDGIELTDR